MFLRQFKLTSLAMPFLVNNFTCDKRETFWHVKFDTPHTHLAFAFKHRERTIFEEDDCGFFGIVMRGYFESHLSEQSSDPEFAVKRIDFNSNLQMAKTEVLCHRALGRESHAFVIDDDIHIIYNWQAGIQLGTFLWDATLDSTQALTVLTSLYRQLKMLHDENFAHHDLNHDNIIINPTTCEIGLVDFGNSSLNTINDPEILAIDLRKAREICEMLIKKVSPWDYNKSVLTTLQSQINASKSSTEALDLCVAAKEKFGSFYSISSVCTIC